MTSQPADAPPGAAAVPEQQQPAVEPRIVALDQRRDARRRSGPGVTYSTDGSLALKDGDGPVGTTASDPNGAARVAVIVARGLIEVLSGWRPPTQLARWTSFGLLQDLERRAPRRPNGERLALLRVRVTQSSDDVAEVCALTHDLVRKRVRVMALRLERRERSWILTRLEAG